MAVSEYDTKKRYRLYHRERKYAEEGQPPNAWGPWIQEDGDFSYLYALYSGLHSASDLVGLEINTLFYECDGRGHNEQMVIGSVYVNSDNTWRLNIHGNVPRSTTFRDLTIVDEKSRDCPQLSAIESHSKK